MVPCPPAEVDAAAAMVEQGAKIVSEIASKVENLANATELGAEEVEKIAQKVCALRDFSWRFLHLRYDCTNDSIGPTHTTVNRSAEEPLFSPPSE